MSGTSLYPVGDDECLICYGPMGAPKFVRPVAVTHNALLGGVDAESPPKVCAGCIVRLTCGHAFHTNCLTGWVTHSAPVADFATPREALPVNTCPFCHQLYPVDDVARTFGVHRERVLDGPQRLVHEDLEDWLIAEDRRVAEERIAKAGPSHVFSNIVGTMAGVYGVSAGLEQFTRYPDGASHPSGFALASAAALMGLGAAGMRKLEDWGSARAQAREREEMRVWMQDAPERAARRVREAAERRAVFAPHLEALLRELEADA